MSIPFDRAVTFYDQTRGLPHQTEIALAQLVRDHTRLQPSSSVLEIGVGTGRIALPLAQHNGYRYTGIDLSYPMLARLQSKDQAGSIALVRGNIAALPFPDSTFAGVVAVHIFHLVDAWQQAMDEARRVLQPDGVLLVGMDDPDPNSPSRRLRLKLTEFAGGEEARRARGLIRQDAIRAALEQRFGPPRSYHTPRWTTTTTSAQVIEQFRDRVWSNTWLLSDAHIAHAVEQAQRWAIEQFGSLHTPLTDTTRFRWDIYTRHAQPDP